MKFLTKYGIGIYLLVTLMFKLYFIFPHSFTNGIYYFLMFFGLISFPFFYRKIFVKKIVFKSFSVFFYINVLNLIYLLFFDRTPEGALYFLAKFVTYNLIMIGLFYNYEYYKKYFVKYFKYVMFFMVLLGKLYGTVEEASGIQRLSIGFNPNDVGVFGMLGMLSILTFDNKLWHKNKINVCLFLFFVLVALLSGSKAALLCMAIAIFFTYGLNYRIVISVFFFIIAAYFSPNLGYITSFDRLNINEGTYGTRDEVYANGIKTIQENVFLGHGLDKYNWTNPIYWDSPDLALGPHSTYLAAVIMYGIFFAFVFFAFVLFFVIKSFKKSYRNHDSFIRFNYYVLLIFLVNSLFETLILGINEFVTVLFWFAVGCVGYNFGFASKKDIERENLSKTIQV